MADVTPRSELETALRNERHKWWVSPQGVFAEYRSGADFTIEYIAPQSQTTKPWRVMASGAVTWHESAKAAVAHVHSNISSQG